jgi:hypothetical protein
MTEIPPNAYAIVWEPGEVPQLAVPKMDDDDEVAVEGQVLTAFIIKLHFQEGFADSMIDELDHMMEADGGR